MSITTARETTKPTKRPHSTNPRSPRFRAFVPAVRGALADAITGEWTPVNEQHCVERVEALGYAPKSEPERLLAARHGGAVGQPFEVRMTRGRASAARRALAERLVALFPGAARAGDLVFYGPAAVDAVEHVLAAADAAGGKIEVKNGRDLRLACAHLLGIGRSITWRARFAGAALPGADPATAASIPWAHLSDEQLTEARRTFAAYLRARIERPVPVRPSDAPACFICGIAEVLALPSRAAEAWHATKVAPETVGGRRGAAKIETEVCATCHAAYREAEGWGPTLLDALVLRAAGVEQHVGAEGVQFDAQAWGVSGRKRPNASPFAHLDLADLAEGVRSGRWL